MTLDRIPMLTNLARRNILGAQNSDGVLCQQGADSVFHMFFNCSFAFLVRGNLYNCFQVTFPVEPKLHSKSHLGLVRGKKLKKIWMVPWFANCWSIWLARNKKIFQHEGVDLLNVMDHIKYRSCH